MLDASPHAPPRGWLSRALARFTPLPATPPQEKASRTGPLIALEGLRAPVWSPRDYATFAREGMMQNAIVYRAVRMVAEAAASVPLLLYEGDVEIETHPLLDLLARPNPVSTQPDLLEAWYGTLLVSGNAYLEAVATGGELRELHALRADRMKVIPGPDGWPEGYEYTANGESIRFLADVVEGVRPILHLKFFHPANDHYGLSPLEAAATAIDIHNTASRWNKALLDNSARPSGALVYTARDGNLSPDQFERLKSELEAGFQGAAHAGRPMLLEGGLDWKSMSLTPKDMDFIEAKHVAAREIALALGVPPMLLGIPGDNTYSNYQEATRSLWRQTVLPLVTRTAKALSAWLSPAWSESLDLRPDLDAIDALSPERDALWSRLEKTTFLTPDEKRAAIGYAPMDAASHKYRPDQARDDHGRWTDEGGGDPESENSDDPKIAQLDRPIQLAQVSGASTMTDVGPVVTTPRGNQLIAPEGSVISRFTVDGMTNNVYSMPRPIGPPENVDVTGWTAYYGPPGTRSSRATGEWFSFEGGVILFLSPNGSRSITKPVAPGF